mgnify:CR=1 FL=1
MLASVCVRVIYRVSILGAGICVALRPLIKQYHIVVDNIKSATHIAYTTSHLLQHPISGTMAPPVTPLLIAIEGGIGAGKSTLLNKLKELFKDKIGISFVDEPVEEWTEHGFLQDMYDGNINRAAFQHMVLMSLASDLLKTLTTCHPTVIISERSPWGNTCQEPKRHNQSTFDACLLFHVYAGTFHVFGKANLSGPELEMFKFTWKRIIIGLPSLDVKYVYLKTSTKCLQHRTQMRGREGESNITQDYMQTIERLHDEWMTGISHKSGKVIIDATKTEEDVFKDVCCSIRAWIQMKIMQDSADLQNMEDVLQV